MKDQKKTTTYQTTVNKHNQRTIRTILQIVQIGRGAHILEEKSKHHTKICTDGFKKGERVDYSVIWNHQKITKRVRPQNTIFSAKQSAIITASTIKEPEKANRNRLFQYIGCSLGQEGYENPKTWTIRKLL
jgi:hypothetical protein